MNAGVMDEHLRRQPFTLAPHDIITHKTNMVSAISAFLNVSEITAAEAAAGLVKHPVML